MLPFDEPPDRRSRCALVEQGAHGDEQVAARIVVEVHAGAVFDVTVQPLDCARVLRVLHAGVEAHRANLAGGIHGVEHGGVLAGHLCERVVVLAGPDVGLEDVGEFTTGERRSVPLEVHVGPRGVRIHVVDAVHLLHPVDRLRAGSHARGAGDAEARARLVELQVMIHRLAVIEAIEVAVAVLGADAELHAVRGAATLRLDGDDAVGGLGAVERGAGGSLHHFDRLDVETAELTDGADVHHDVVDDDQGTLAASLRVERGGTTHQDLGRCARAARGGRDAHAGDLALQGANGINRRHDDVFGRDATNRERNLGAFRAFDRAGHDDFVELVDVLLHREVQGLRTRPDRDGLDLRLLADGTDPDVDALTTHASGGDIEGIDTLRVGSDRKPKVIDIDVGGFQR